MTVNASSRQQVQGFPNQLTGPIPNNAATPAPTAPVSSEANLQTPSSNQASQSTLSKTVTPKGESLTSIDLHGPEDHNQTQSATAAYNGNPHRGARLQTRLFERQGLEISSENNGKARSSNPENRAESMDLPMAMLIQTEQASSLDDYQMALQTVLQRIPSLNPNATPPLSQSEVFKLNQTLSKIGLSTDGKTMFNMTLRVAGPKGVNDAAAAPCSKYETEMLLDLVSTRQACLKVPAGEPNPFAINKITSLTAAPGSGPLGMISMAALGAVEGTDKKEAVEAMVLNSLRAIQENQTLMAHLLPAAAEADRELEAAIVQVAQVRTEATAEQLTFTHLSDARESLKPGRPLPNPSVINPQLASLNLQVGQSNGQMTFFKGGKQITESVFRQALNSGMWEQLSRLEAVKVKLHASEQNLITKREVSADFSHKISQVKDNLTKNLDLLNQIVSNNPNISADLKRQVSEVATAVKKMISQADTQLKRSEALRQQATLALLALQLALNQLNKNLGDAQIELKQSEIQPNSKNSIHQAGDDVLTELEQQPHGARLNKLAEDWLKLSEDSLGDSFSLHRSKQNEQAQQREYFDRASQALRESLNYHQKQLEKFDKAGQQKLTQALREHIQITQQLSSDQ